MVEAGQVPEVAVLAERELGVGRARDEPRAQQDRDGVGAHRARGIAGGARRTRRRRITGSPAARRRRSQTTSTPPQRVAQTRSPTRDAGVVELARAGPRQREVCAPGRRASTTWTRPLQRVTTTLPSASARTSCTKSWRRVEGVVERDEARSAGRAARSADAQPQARPSDASAKQPVPSAREGEELELGVGRQRSRSRPVGVEDARIVEHRRPRRPAAGGRCSPRSRGAADRRRCSSRACASRAGRSSTCSARTAPPSDEHHERALVVALEAVARDEDLPVRAEGELVQAEARARTRAPRRVAGSTLARDVEVGR